MVKKKKTRYDWEAIWKDYRPGVLSIREVASKHGVDASYLCRKAKQLGVTRDLTNRVKQEVRTKLVHGSVHTPSTTDEKIVEEESNKVVGVVLLHRKDIQRGRENVALLMARLEESLGNVDAITEEIGSSEEITSRGKAMMMNAVSLPVQSKVVGNLANALKTFIGLEREAFNLENSGDDDAGNRLLDAPNPIIADMLETPEKYTPGADE